MTPKTMTTPTPRSLSIPKLQFQAGIDYQQSVLAAQTSLPLTPELLAGNMTELPKVETMVSINLNHQRGGGNRDDTMTNYFDDKDDDDDNDDTTSPMAPPPLWLSLKHTSNAAWVMNLSQVLTFDRPVLNPLDERAPNIRQTLGWVVQVEKEALPLQLSPSNNSTNHNNNSKTSWSAGATFQLNRNTACKAVRIDGHTLRYVAIFKRRSHPLLTLSFFHSLHIPTGQHGYIGFGSEVETASTAANDATTATTNNTRSL